MARTSLLLALFIGGTLFPAFAQATPGGNIPCIWGVVVYLSSIREACDLKTDIDMGNALSDSIERLEGYIVKYSKDPNIAHRLMEEKRETLNGLQRLASTQGCNAAQDYVQFYNYFAQHNSPQSVRKEMDEALSLPRTDPFEGSCL